MNLIVNLGSAVGVNLEVSEFRFVLSQRQLAFLMEASSRNFEENANFVSSTQTEAANSALHTGTENLNSYPSNIEPDSTDNSNSNSNSNVASTPPISSTEGDVWKSKLAELKTETTITTTAKVNFKGVSVEIFAENGGYSLKESVGVPKPLSIARLAFGMFGAEVEMRGNEAQDTYLHAEVFLDDVAIEDTRIDTAVHSNFREALSSGVGKTTKAIELRVKQVWETILSCSYYCVEILIDVLCNYRPLIKVLPTVT